jgi:PEP-CTERM motif
MKKLVTGMALAVACLVPLSAAKAFDFCTTGLALNFCGSVVVTTSLNTVTGGTNVVLTVLNTSGGPLGGNPLAVFTSIGLTDVSSIGTLGPVVVRSGGIDYSSHWALTTGAQGGGGITVDINAGTIPGSTIKYGISSACSGTTDRIYTGGIGGCGFTNNVTISFSTSTAWGTFTAGDVFVKAQGVNSSECDFSLTSPTGVPTGCNQTTVPEPATLTLFGTGLLALGSRVKRWRRRNNNV